MMSTVLQIELEDDVFTAMQQDPFSLAVEMRVAAAVKWYEMGRLSQDKAAEIAGMSRSDFMFTLRRFSVSPFQESAEEILKAVV
jgi:predicted HTH domain antitoxin